MIGRKQQVIETAHRLFVEKGFQATSIQDILDQSGISKGTFYNYFSSKTELFTALLGTIQAKMERDRDQLLIGQDPSDIEIFIKQIVLHMEENRFHKLSMLVEEVRFSKDDELLKAIRTGQFRLLRWVSRRFVELFGNRAKPYVLDCAIMFKGMLHQMLTYHSLSNDAPADARSVVRYCVRRIERTMREVSDSGDRLLSPDLLERWLPERADDGAGCLEQLCRAVTDLKDTISRKEQPSVHELLDFIRDELLYAGEPRKFLLDSALLSLRSGSLDPELLERLERLVSAYFAQR